MEKEEAEKTKSQLERWNRMSSDQLVQEFQHVSQSCDTLAGQLKCDTDKWSHMVASMQAQITSMQLLYDAEVSALKRTVDDLHEQLTGSRHTLHQGTNSAVAQCEADRHGDDTATAAPRDSPGQHTQLQPTANERNELGVELECSSPEFSSEAEFEDDLDLNCVLDAVTDAPLLISQLDPSLKNDNEMVLEVSHNGETGTLSQALSTAECCNVERRKGLRGNDASRTNTEPQSQTFQKCQTNCSSLIKMKEHVCRESLQLDKKPHKCPNCEAAFPSLSLLKRHTVFHSGDRPFKCVECGLCFPLPNSLRRHMATHLSNKPYQCVDCAASFAECSNARRHRIRKKHRVERRQVDLNFKPYQCSECETRFARAHNLKVHMLTHLSEERPFKCWQCGKSYTTSRNLVSHRHYMHSGCRAQIENKVEVKPHPFMQCGASFAHAVSLKRHMMTHACKEKCPETPPLFEAEGQHGEDTDPVQGRAQAGRDSADESGGEDTDPAQGRVQAVRDSVDASGGEDTDPVQGQVQAARDRVDESGREAACDSPAEFSGEGGFESSLELDSVLAALTDATLSTRETTVPQGGNAEINVNTSCGCDSQTPVLSGMECPSVQSDVRVAVDAESSVVGSVREGDKSSTVRHQRSLARTQILARGCAAVAGQTNAQTCAKCNTTFASVNDFEEHACGVSVKKQHKCADCEATFRCVSFLKRHMVCHSGDRPYKCVECGSSFPLPSSLKRHMATHLINKPYQCADCGASFAEATSAKRHGNRKRHQVEKRQVDLKPHQCSECQAKFARARSLKSHLLTHMAEARPFWCVQCGNSYKTARSLSSHRRYKHAGQCTKKCSQCDASFMSSYLLLKHMSTHAGLRGHQCDTCKKTFVTAHSLKAHVDIIHKGRKRVECCQCGERFSWTTQLEAHMVMHTGVKPHLCAECGASFTLRSHLKVHISRRVCKKSKSFNPLEHSTTGTSVTDSVQKGATGRVSMKEHLYVNSVSDGMQKGATGTVSMKEHLCAECGARFTRKSHLIGHMLTHATSEHHKCQHCGEGFKTLRRLKSHAVRFHKDERPFKCTECDAAFTRADSLRYHRFTHTNKKPLKCTECDASFVRPSLLRAHMARHRGEKPFKCTECQATFSAAGHLKYHQFIHTGNKPHKCSVCTASYVTPSQLRFHMASHTGDKPHKCEECGAGFFYPNRLKLHMVVHTGVKKYKCEECRACFSQASGRRVHMRRAHGQPLECTDSSETFTTVGSWKNKAVHKRDMP